MDYYNASVFRTAELLIFHSLRGSFSSPNDERKNFIREIKIYGSLKKLHKLTIQSLPISTQCESWYLFSQMVSVFHFLVKSGSSGHIMREKGHKSNYTKTHSHFMQGSINFAFVVSLSYNTSTLHDPSILVINTRES